MRSTPRSALALAALATVAIPGLEVVATKPTRQGGVDADAIGVKDSRDRRWIVRAPRHDAAGAAMEGEVALLEGLADVVDRGLLPFDVPRPAGFATLDGGGRAMVYPEIVGAPVDPGRLRPGSGLLAAMTRAVAALHELDGDVVRAAGLPDYDADSYRRRRLAELDEAATSGHVPAALHRRWEHALEDVRLWRFTATPVHGDLASEHVLVSGERVAGIVDWADARVADPADDVAWLLSEAPEDCAEEILRTYASARTGAIDDHFEDRATLAGELAVVRWLMHGVHARSDEVIDDAVAMLAELDEMLVDASPIGYVEPVVEVVPPPVGDGQDEPREEQDLDEQDLGEQDGPDIADPAPAPPTIAPTAPGGADDEPDVRRITRPTGPADEAPTDAIRVATGVISLDDREPVAVVRPPAVESDDDPVLTRGDGDGDGADGDAEGGPAAPDMPEPDDDTPTTELPLGR